MILSEQLLTTTHFRGIYVTFLSILRGFGNVHQGFQGYSCSEMRKMLNLVIIYLSISVYIAKIHIYININKWEDADW